MKKAALITFLFGALFAKSDMVEFELEALDFYDPVVSKFAKEEALKSVSIAGVYFTGREKLSFEGSSERDVTICVPDVLPRSKTTTDDSLMPQDRISAYIAADYFSKFAAAPKNLLSAVANDCKGLHLSYDAVEVINTRCSLRHNYSFAAKDNERFFDEDEREFYMQSSSMINEYRYAKDGKLFRIDGFITHASEVFKVVKNKKVLIKNAMDGLIEQSERDSLYRIYFFPDKTRKIYFGQSQKSSSDLNYLEKYNLIKNNDLKYLAEYEKKIWDKYGGKDEQKLQTFNRNMGYVKRILSASDEELQKEFDEIYKKNFRPIEIKEGRCDYDY